MYKKVKNPHLLHSRTQPVLNLQEDTQVPMSNSADGTGSGNPSGLKETPIDKVVDVERGLASYQFASLPFNGIWFDDQALTNTYDIAYRMTSPYDCVVASLKTDHNTGTGIQNDISIIIKPCSFVCNSI